MSGFKRLIHEVHRRSLWQVLLIYIAASWVVLEAADVLVSRLALPEWVYGAAIVLLLVGLPIVLATAFIQEGVAPSRPEPLGVADDAAKTGTQPHEATGVRRLFTWRNAIGGGVLAFALWGVVATGLLLLGDKTESQGILEGAAERKSIAVLPFANMSADLGNEYFSDGITDDIITHLSKIADLKVISRQSSMQYKGSEKNLREIAEELSVAFILEGGVQRVGDRVRINVQLIDAETDEHLWAEQYNRELTDVFAIQSDVARQIATALRATLSLADKERIERKPTEHLGAYDYYLRGNEYYRRFLIEEDARTAVQMYERAVELDPDFAVAYAALSRVLVWLAFNFGQRDALPVAKEALDRALQLDRDLPEVYLALGDYHYYGYREYDEALEQYNLVQERQPSNADAIAFVGWIQRRQGKWNQHVANVERALKLDPRNHGSLYSLGQSLVRMRRYPEAERYLDRAIALAPHHPHGYQEKALLYLSWHGDRERARQVLQEAVRRTDLGQLLTYPLWKTGILFRIFADDLAGLLERVPLETLTSVIDTAGYFLAKAEVSAWRTERQSARAYYDSARVALEKRVQAELDLRSQHPGEARILLGIAYAGLGRAEEATREGEQAVDLLPPSRDALVGPYGIVYLAWIYVMVGEHDAAIEQLEYLLSVPSIMSVKVLQLDPIWDPLRSHPRFQALLEKYSEQ